MEDNICGKPIKLGTSRDGTIDFSYDVSVFPGKKTIINSILVGGSATPLKNISQLG